MFKKVLIANRGAIACRIIRTLKKMGVKSVAVFSEADAHSLHVAEADEAVCIGPAPANESYLSVNAILDAARQTGAEAIHPGYGFLSENAAFAEACAEAGIVFVGPSPAQIREFGLKHTARALADLNGVPMLPGSELLADLDTARSEANRIGFPVILKSTAGGGGIGMRVCDNEEALVDAFDSVRHLAAGAFSEAGVFVEKFVGVARHIEVQVFGDSHGNVVSLGERDCSAQRRNQKVVEETPAPGLSDDLRQELQEAAVRLTAAVGYQSAGTVEFLFDASSLQFYFLEVNTRLQVEHGVTEEVTGVDLVEWMIRQAAGELDLTGFVDESTGVSIQVRLYAEDPNKDFQPSSGLLTEAKFSEGARVETWVEADSEVSAFYDPMIAKMIVSAPTRPEAVDKLQTVLEETRICGVESNLDYLRQVTNSREFIAGEINTRWLAGFPYEPQTVDVIEPGTQSSIQDYPGRTGYWSVGVPPSGPMDDFAFRIANELVDNETSAAALEITLNGPTLRFNRDATIALTGASMEAKLDGNEIPFWRSLHIRAGSILALGGIQGAGCRTYLAVAGGFDVPDYLGSKSTFTLGRFGGHAGRFLRHGDVLHLNRHGESFVPLKITPPNLIPKYHSHWEIAVLLGPHAAPDFLTEKSMEMFFSTDWKVHYNSNRLGIRLNGPKPEFARSDGGEAGLHPSNIHDCEYAIGTINLSGDMPIILGKDGPSLGGFICPFTIVKAELWKIGQLRPGDTIRFVRTTYVEAVTTERRQDRAIAELQEDETALSPVALTSGFQATSGDGPILHQTPPSETSPGLTCRQAGDKYLLLEYGPNVLDLEVRFRIHALMEYLHANPVEGILELSPGIRSLQINFDSRVIFLRKLLAILLKAEKEIPSVESLEIPTRILHLPLAFNAGSTRAAIEKYQRSVRDKAPWLPDNIEFIRRINGLSSVEEVEAIVFKASYMVFGLGDVYLGAPCAVPVDPRHRLLTTKYNPARTWTAEGEVGIGGVYLCVYGMESPGGYQLVGRTVPVWNTHKETSEFRPGHPWLLRFFDQIRFYPMPEAKVLKYREAFQRGQVSLDISEETFSVREYREFLKREENDIAAFRTKQQAAFEEERERWVRDGSAALTPVEDAGEPESDLESISVSDGGSLVSSPVSGNMWAVPVKVGDRVERGQKIAVIEAMKMEVPIEATASGIVTRIIAPPGTLVTAGQPVVVLEEEVPV